jgi:hypothetical protein
VRFAYYARRLLDMGARIQQRPECRDASLMKGGQWYSVLRDGAAFEFPPTKLIVERNHINQRSSGKATSFDIPLKIRSRRTDPTPLLE